MAIDTGRIGAMAMEFLESLEQRFGDEANLETVAFIAAVDIGDAMTLTWQFRDGQGNPAPVHVSRGMLAETDRGLTSNT
ncbi:MAG: hypothetical protein QOF76_3569 [Solirubrobacteraceae bacterium]|jgi:hypothetical protein|nr:hypothetical protein [Solirubrobacteraceae bacterium]